MLELLYFVLFLFCFFIYFFKFDFSFSFMFLDNEEICDYSYMMHYMTLSHKPKI